MEMMAGESGTGAVDNEVLVERGHVLLALYEGALGFMRHAMAAQERRDFGRYTYFLDRAQGVIEELMRTLDHRQGPELANMLAQLYEFMIFQIGEAKRTRDAETVRAEARRLGQIYESYREVVAGLETKSANTGGRQLTDGESHTAHTR